MTRIDEETIRCEKCKTMRVPFNRIVDVKKVRSYMIWRCPKCGSQIKIRDKKPIIPSGTVIPKKPRGTDLERWATGKGYLNKGFIIIKKWFRGH